MMSFQLIHIVLAVYYISIIDGYSPSSGPSSQPEAYFNGSSYLRLQTIISLKRQAGVSFRTCSGGILFSQNQNDDLLELTVISDGVLLTAKTLGQQYREIVLGNFLNNKWHAVLLEYTLGNFTLRVDNEMRLIANATYRNELLISAASYNEGAAVLLIGKHFNGCLLEGPSLVFNVSIISSTHNVRFEKCPIPEDSCMPKENLRDYDFCIHEPCMGQGKCINDQKGYTCACQSGFTGKNCEIDRRCDKDPAICKNGATCQSDNSGDYKCICAPDYTGKHCDHQIISQHQCQHNPCLNGATCIDDGNIECLCLPGFTGSKCETNIDDCRGNPCKNGGICIDGLNNFTCECGHTGYNGRFCEVNINECLSKPCLNYGTCFDNYGGYMCQCAPGFAGSNCQYTSGECISQPCFNHGVCIDHANGYTCQCRPGYGGEHCEIEDRQMLCDANKCLPYADCIDSGNSYRCVCKQQYPGIYPNCSIDNICNNSPCKNGGTCMAWNGAFNCTCLPRFTGKYCQHKIDGCTSFPCLNGGTCIDQINGFTCNCTDQWMGDLCEILYDACELNPCLNNATCITSANKKDFTCKCLSGFEGKRCEININDCSPDKCPPGKICVDLVDNYECRCPTGFTGENCSVDVAPCAKEPCMNGATCEVNKTSLQFSCICRKGYTGTFCENDVDECKLNPTICNEGICMNEEGDFQCYCKPGYTGERCNLDFDECLSMPCRNNATCINQINNYECQCPPGYEGKDCSIDINECEPMPCVEGSTCYDGINEFTCACQPGLTGRICDINIDDCASSPCLHSAQCIDGLNSYTCNCTDTGYTGIHCDINIDDCIGNPCQNGAQCFDEVKDYSCQCYPGYTGKNCEEDINECLSNPCQHSGTCLEKSNKTLYLPDISQTLPEIFQQSFNYSTATGYICVCVNGVTGKNCEIDINECESSPCIQGSCDDKIGGYVCICNEGFEGEHCDIDIDECERYKPCIYGKCQDRKANYLCECEPGYGGKNCSVQLIGCQNNPCLNYGSCKPYLVNENIHKFNCSCPNGYHGDICEHISTMSFSGKSLVMINTTREEGYDIQFRFKTTLGDGLLALGKGLTYYILELSKGRLNLHSSLLNKLEGVFIGSNLNDSNWQRVFVAINSTHLVLSANDEQTIYPITFNENNNDTYTSFPLTYIGGIPSNLKKLTHGQPFLVGCTEDVLINGEWVLPEVQNVPSMTLQNVVGGCHREPQCKPNPCHSGGHCTDLWLDFRCTCGRPYLGHTCQYNYTAATFGYENITDSLVTVSVDSAARRAVRTIVDISMFIRTRQPKGQIFYLGSALGSANTLDETYIAAQLEGGELLVRIQFNGTPEAYTVGGVKLDNGYNHLIEVIRNVTFVQVKLNGTEYFRKTISATGTLDAQVLFLGGQPQLRSVRQANDNLIKADIIAPTTSAAITTPLSNVHFKGIIQDVQISNGSSTMVVEFFPLEADDLEIPAPFGIVNFDNNTVLEGVRSDDSCRINPCQRNGICENTWNDYRCICPRGFKGKDCTELEFCQIEKCPDGSICNNLENGYECLANGTFDGNTPPLQYKFFTSIPNTTIPYDTIELTYRTRSWGTVLYAKYEEDYFAIFIYHNEVVIEWNINKNANSTRFRKDRFEGQWLTLYFEYKNSILKGGFKDMVMDEAPDIKDIYFDTSGLTRIFNYGTIYVAGSDNTFNYQDIIDSADYNMTGYIPTSDATTTISIIGNSLEMPDSYSSETLLYKVDQNKKTDYFKGCLREIRIGGLILPFFTMNELYPSNYTSDALFELTNDYKVDIGCILCYNSDCFNQGYCINPLDTYRCNCTEGYAADDCSIDINECESNQCENNSTCKDLVGRYECECLLGFDGVNCENDIDECQSNPCRHGGTCTDHIATFKCECPEDFVGKQCEAPLLITCDNKPCKEGATCKTGPNGNNNFTCFCTEGMEGPLCDTAFCINKPCDNGFCNTSNDVPFCQCERGFDGKFCEIDIDDCLLPTGGSPCQNGGVCIDRVNRYDCNCTTTGYTGLLCEMDIDECVTIDGVCGPNGTCDNLPGGFKCICQDPMKCGQFCKFDNPCEMKHPCLHGVCMPDCLTTADYVCNCHENYTGKNCTDLKVAANQASGGVNILYIVIPIILIILLAIVIGLAVLVNVARSKRATRGTYSPSAQEFCNPRVELDHVLKPPPEERLI